MIERNDIVKAMLQVAEYSLQFKDTDTAAEQSLGVNFDELVAVAKSRAYETIREAWPELFSLLRQGNINEFLDEFQSRLATEWIEGFGAGIQTSRNERSER